MTGSGKFYLMLPNGSIIGPLTWWQALMRRLPGESIVAADQIEPKEPAAIAPDNLDQQTTTKGDAGCT